MLILKKNEKNKNYKNMYIDEVVLILIKQWKELGTEEVIIIKKVANKRKDFK